MTARTSAWSATTACPLGAVPGGATFSGSLTPAGTTYNLGGGGVLTVAFALTGNNSLLVNNTLILAGNNTYTGTTTIAPARWR